MFKLPENTIEKVWDLTEAPEKVVKLSGELLFQMEFEYFSP